MADPEHTVRLGSIGLGWWGDTLADAAARAGGAKVVTCFARSEEARRSFADRHGCRAAATLEELLADPEVDGVLIATPHSTHADLIVAAAEAGKHVFVDKPFTLDVAAGRRAIQAADAAGVTLQVGHHRRRLGGNRKLRELIDSGELGMIHQLEATYCMPGYQTPKPGWRGDPAESPAGGMTALGVHMIDTLSYLAGPIARVSAFSKRLLGRWAVDDATVVVLEFERGPLGYLGTSLVLPRVIDLSVLATEASAWSEDDGSRVLVQRKDETARTPLAVRQVDGLADELAEFAACARGDAKPETGGPEGLEVVAVLQAIVESVRSRAAVDVDRFRNVAAMS